MKDILKRIEVLGVDGDDCPPGLSRGHWLKVLSDLRKGKRLSRVGMSLVAVVCDVKLGERGEVRMEPYWGRMGKKVVVKKEVKKEVVKAVRTVERFLGSGNRRQFGDFWVMEVEGVCWKVPVGVREFMIEDGEYVLEDFIDTLK